MPDILSPKQRSERMARVKSRGNASTEIALARAFRRSGVRGWRRHVRVSMETVRGAGGGGGGRHATVRPDFVFRAERVAVFVDGCFWHACPRHGTSPRGNAVFWRTKLEANRRRDRTTTAALRRRGWKVIRFWEHDVRQRPDTCARRVERLLGANVGRTPGRACSTAVSRKTASPVGHTDAVG
jgi:DNA mismatch endonuclease (patch repair protein)